MQMDPEPFSAAAASSGGRNIISLQNEREVVRSAGRQAISSFLDAHDCFSVLRASGKVVVFDTHIPIQLAFYALVEHDMHAAPLWDPALCQFVGLLTVTDFIDILRYYRQHNLPASSLATRSIADIFADAALLEFLKKKPGLHFWSADPTTSLKQACRLLHGHQLDFLPILFPEDMRVLSTITYTNILEHLVTHFREQRRLFDDSIYDLGIGTYHDKVITVTPQNTLARALDLMHLHNLSAIPIVKGKGKNDSKELVGVYSRSDITFLATAANAQDAITNLDVTLEQILKQHEKQQRSDVTTPDALHVCGKSHTLQSIFEYFAQLRFNRLFIVEDDDTLQAATAGAGTPPKTTTLPPPTGTTTGRRLLGVVSARDLAAYFLDD